MENNIKFNFYGKYINNNKPFYKNKLYELKNSKKIYLLDFKNNLNNSTFLVPIKELGLIMPVFENQELVNKYLEINESLLKDSLIIREISYSILEKLINNLFYKGLDGIIYYSETPIFYQVDKFLLSDLINEDTKKILNILNKVLLAKENFYYIYKDLSTKDVLMGKVKFLIRSENNIKYVDLFLNRESAEDYCSKKNIIVNENKSNKILNDDKNIINNKNVLDIIGADKDKEIYPVSSIMNELLFDVIKELLNREDDIIEYIKIHEMKHTYKIQTKEFFRLIINVGFNLI